jgi:pyruvate/2-oxoglutarate dehydrogenase complex dihydrolipoamide acyltransferase (E2) component
MAKVEFIYSKNGKRVPMAMRYAETLRKLGHGTYETRMLTAGAPVAPAAVVEPLVSDAIAEFAAENNVDLSKVVGTGKDGRIRKSDVEAAIDAQDLA